METKQLSIHSSHHITTKDINEAVMDALRSGVCHNNPHKERVLQALAQYEPSPFPEMTEKYGFLEKIHVSGHFTCGTLLLCAGNRNGGWDSNMICVWIWGTIGVDCTVTVWAQRCQACGIRASLKLDEGAYANSVASALRKWMGAGAKEQHWRVALENARKWQGLVAPIHRYDLCEACLRHGTCCLGREAVRVWQEDIN